MTQEIFGYFLIRSTLINNESESLINTYSDKCSFAYFIENIARLIDQDDLFLISNKLIDKVEAVLYSYRFQFNKDKQINDDMNKIINKFREYKNMKPQEVLYRNKKWLEEEAKLRGIPKLFATTEIIYESISKDFTNMTVITSTNGTICPNDLINYIMNINYIANKFPIILLENQIRNNIILNLEELIEDAKKIHFTLPLRIYMKNTINNLKSLSKEIDEELTSEEKQKVKTINNK